MSIHLKKYILGSIIILIGCSTPKTIVTFENNTLVYEHIDHDDQPKGCTRGPFNGCAMGNHIWYSGVSGPHVRQHELSHVYGMKHTDWEYNSWYKANCSIVIKELLPKYPLNATICAWSYKEEIFIK